MTNETAGGSAANGAALPMFYKNPRPIEPARHARAGLRETGTYGFARATNAIPLTIPELAHAARSYPIVFSKQAPTLPFALVGLRDEQNLFVDDAGRWREDAYIPAYVRRYPFIFSEETDSQRLILCVDEGAEQFETQSARPFFVDGQPAPALQRVLKFGEAFQAQYEDTRRCGEWLERHGMLEDKMARIELDAGQIFTLRGFRLVDAQKVRELQDSQVLELHKQGWLPLLHFHLQSLHNWAVLSRLMRGASASLP